MRLKLQQNHLKQLFALVTKYPWLAEDIDGLSNLLKECCTNAEITLIVDLLTSFEFVGAEAVQQHLAKVAAKIVLEWAPDPNSCLVTCPTHDSSPDSGQAILWYLKDKFAKYRFIPHMNNRVDRFRKQVTPDRDWDVIIVDEFVGTGSTMVSRVTELRDAFSQMKAQKSGTGNLRVKVATIAAMENGLTAVKACADAVHAEIVLRKGISDAHAGVTLVNRLADMVTMEERLKQDALPIPFPSLGYKKTEALYAQQHGNAPNNVFPIFWWAVYANGSPRKTLLQRHERWEFASK